MFGKTLTWFSNKSEADYFLNAVLTADPDDNVPALSRVEIIDLPNTKKAILSWLNNETFARTDNG